MPTPASAAPVAGAVVVETGRSVLVWVHAPATTADNAQATSHARRDPRACPSPVITPQGWPRIDVPSDQGTG